MPQIPKHGAARFVVDFELGDAALQASEPELEVSAQGAQVIEQHTEKNDYVHGYRASFLVRPDAGNQDMELRALLKGPSGVLTETWSYLWQPN